MNKLIILVFISLLFSCNQKTQIQSDNMLKAKNTKYATLLIDNDFLKYGDSSRIDSIKSDLLLEFDIYSEGIERTAYIDGEELAEFNFDFFLPELNRILYKRNIKLSAQKLNHNDNSFDSIINGDVIKLYIPADLENNIFWDKAPRNFFKKVNEILESKKSKEKFYLINGGNDLHTMLLTNKQFSIISEYYKTSEKDKPYSP